MARKNKVARMKRTLKRQPNNEELKLRLKKAYGRTWVCC
jgi:hypothetical protein